MSEVILLILTLLCVFTIYCLYKLFDKNGIYYSKIILNIIGLVLAFKITSVFKMNINIGIIPFIISLTNLYIFILKYGKKELKSIIKLTLYSNIMVAILLIITNYFIPTITETVSINMKETFEYNYKILFSYPIIALLSQYTVIKLFNFVSKIQNNIIIDIILTYIITSLLYTITFSLVSYIQVLSFRDSIFIGISTYIIGFIVTIINIIFIYFITGKKVIKWEIYY